MRSILITGCSTGIGYDAAHALAARGWTVFAGCRQEKDVGRLKAEGLNAVLIDYENTETFAPALGEVLSQTDGKLDALFNNGAYGIPGAVEDLPINALRQIFEANLFGWHELTRQIIPIMRAQGSGRIVQCSSVLGLTAMPWRGAYNATKFALEGLTDTMRLELKGSGIQVALIEPGPITTKFRVNARAQFDRWIDWKNSAISERYAEELVPRLYKSAEDATPDLFELGTEAVTAKLIHALEAKKARPHYYVTTATYIAAICRRLLPVQIQDYIWSKV